MPNPRINFAQSFHHQSMPIFHIPQSLHPSSPKDISSLKMDTRDQHYEEISSDDNNNFNKSSQSSCKGASYEILQRSLTNFLNTNKYLLNANNNSASQLASVFQPLRKKCFSNGVLHSVTPDYSSQSSCDSCCTSGIFIKAN